MRNRVFLFFYSAALIGGFMVFCGEMHEESFSSVWNQFLFDNIHAIIFDCDGVLVDGDPLKFRAWRTALNARGVDFSLEEYMPMIGESTDTTLALICSLKKIALPHEVIDERDAAYKTLQAQEVIPIVQTVAFAKQLGAQKNSINIKIGLASSAPRQELYIALQRIGLEDAFDIVVSGEDDLAAYGCKKDVNKPKPYIYQEAAKRLNVNPEQCLVFEDSSAGVIAAADAGMKVVAVPNPLTVGQDFRKATVILHSLSELSGFPLLKKTCGNV